MKLTFLGTGTSQGVPVIGCKCDVCRSVDSKDKRLRSSLLIETGSKVLVIDSGPDFRQQMLRENVEKLDAIIFTHEHKDHTAGTDDIRAFNYLQHKPMDIYAEKRVIESLKKEFSYVFTEFKYPGVPQMTVHEIENKPFDVEGIEITPIRVYHHMLPVFGYRIGKLAYITDTSQIPDEELPKLQGLDVLIINALRKVKHISHFNLEEALEVISKVKPKMAYLNHISHLLGSHKEIQNELPENVFLAYDGLVVSSK